QASPSHSRGAHRDAPAPAPSRNPSLCRRFYPRAPVQALWHPPSPLSKEGGLLQKNPLLRHCEGESATGIQARNGSEGGYPAHGRLVSRKRLHVISLIHRKRGLLCLESTSCG